MAYYIPTILTGILLVALAGWLLTAEEQRRKVHFQRCYHTSFLDLNTKKARKLYRSHYIIGRRKRRCDIYVKGAISRVHAVLWHDGANFCIAPSRDLEILKLPADEKALPDVYVNGDKVPEEGVALCYGDVIRLGDGYFTLKNTEGTEDE